MSTIPACPVCAMENTYQDGDHYICPDCAHEWPVATAADEGEEAEKKPAKKTAKKAAEGEEDEKKPTKKTAKKAEDKAE